MKQSPDQIKLEQILRSSKIVAGGFLGNDQRTLYEIIEADSSQLAHLDLTPQSIADQMRMITDKAKKAIGTWTKIDEKRKAKIIQAKGRNVCPWPHPACFDKTVTILKNTDTNDEIFWSDLNIHLIEHHNFFEGKGSKFRIEPNQLTKAIF